MKLLTPDEINAAFFNVTWAAEPRMPFTHTPTKEFDDEMKKYFIAEPKITRYDKDGKIIKDGL